MAMLAGFETSATTLTWGLFCLVQHPHVQEKLYQDIMKHAPPEGEDITLEHVENMEYLHAYFNEVLRMYPSIAKTERRNLNPEKIEGVLVPAGTRFRMNIALVHRHPKYWDEPESFNPDRWINVSKAEQERRRFAYMPFGAGARDCIGKNLATMEIRLVICALARAFYIELAPSQRDTKFKIVSDIVLKMSPLVKIVVKKRNSS
jgi:cytochrome P450 family 4 subfamily V/cytochrome P450 family 31 subfamily A